MESLNSYYEDDFGIIYLVEQDVIIFRKHLITKKDVEQAAPYCFIFENLKQRFRTVPCKFIIDHWDDHGVPKKPIYGDPTKPIFIGLFKKEQNLDNKGGDVIASEGNFSVVKKVKNGDNNYAVKTLILRHDDEDREAFYKDKMRQSAIVEFVLLKLCRHSNIMKVFDIDVVNHAYSCELAPHGSLKNVIELNGTLVRQGLLKHFIRCRLKLAFNIATGMAFIHSKGGIHRDLKLANILVFNDNTDVIYILLAKLCDFGISSFKNYFPTVHMYSNQTISTMAPENFGGQNPIDTKSEVFSFAIILWQLYCLSEAKYQTIDGVLFDEKK